MLSINVLNLYYQPERFVISSLIDILLMPSPFGKILTLLSICTFFPPEDAQQLIDCLPPSCNEFRQPGLINIFPDFIKKFFTLEIECENVQESDNPLARAEIVDLSASPIPVQPTESLENPSQRLHAKVMEVLAEHARKYLTLLLLLLPHIGIN